MPNIGPLELVIVLVIVLLIFGPKRLPSLGRQLGSGMREFKDSLTGRDGSASKERERPALHASEADAPAPAATSAEPHAAPADAPEHRG